MKKMNLSVKLIGGFLIVGALVLIVGLLGLYSLNVSEKTSAEIAYSKDLTQNLLKREIDHLDWARSVGQFQRDENMVSLGVETDEHKCTFGKWYYGDERKKAEQELPEIIPFLTQIEESHRKLHETAQAIEDTLKKGKDFRQDAIALYETKTLKSLRDVKSYLGDIMLGAEKHSQ
jgi:methyl-accepting chemotaxis protein